jgi:hypothetical protein
MLLDYVEWWTCISTTKKPKIRIHIKSRGVLWKTIESLQMPTIHTESKPTIKIKIVTALVNMVDVNTTT